MQIISLEDFLDEIKGAKIINCFVSNRTDENELSLDIDIDYGDKEFVIELDNGKKITFSGGGWNYVCLRERTSSTGAIITKSGDIICPHCNRKIAKVKQIPHGVSAFVCAYCGRLVKIEE